MKVEVVEELQKIHKEICELKCLVKAIMVSQIPRSGPKRQSTELRRYIAEVIIRKLKALGIPSKGEAERLLCEFCCVDKFEKLTQPQAEAFYIHLQEKYDAKD